MSDDEIEIQDADSCSPGELSSFFQYPLELRYEHTIPEENYILSMDFSPFVLNLFNVKIVSKSFLLF